MVAFEKYTKTTPGAEVVTLTEMKAYLHVEDIADDGLIQSLIDGWTDWAEGYCWSSFNETEWTLKLDAWAADITLRKNPVKSITSINYQDVDDAPQSFTDWRLYPDVPARIEILDMPTLYKRWDAITIVFLTENLESLKTAKLGIQALVALQYMQREDYNPDGPYTSLAKRIFGPYRLNYF